MSAKRWKGKAETKVKPKMKKSELTDRYSIWNAVVHKYRAIEIKLGKILEDYFVKIHTEIIDVQGV